MKKQTKVHPLMTKEQMREIREEMLFSLRDLAAVTHRKYRTLQNYEGGQRDIPQEFADQLRAEQIKERRIKAELAAAMEARFDLEYPNGIRSTGKE